MPGVRMRSLPEPNALLIVATESVGWAMKDLLIGLDGPGVGVCAQVVPEVFVWTEGTKTLSFPLESVYRYGSSRVTGLVASVVYVGLGNDWAGAPTTPENTWFQTALVQPSILLFLVIHCCCAPLTMVLPLNSESAMNPPPEKFGLLQ